jgi:hypothetical protein
LQVLLSEAVKKIELVLIFWFLVDSF